MLKTDKLIKDQAVKRHIETDIRRKRETKLPQGYGNTVVGSIFDCNRKGFERAIRAYSDRLYVGWNPFKKDGRGCWEVWHRPSKKVPVLQTDPEKDGIAIYTLEYKPNDFEHWVADLDYLSYDFIGELHRMDAWNNKHLLADHDEKIEELRQKNEKAEEEHLKYVVKHNKQAFRDLLDYTQSGFNPLDFFTRK